MLIAHPPTANQETDRSIRKRRVLVISPHFPPINAPDHQRIRVALPYLSEFGWEATVLAVKPQHVPHSQDQKLVEALDENLKVIYVDALSARYTKLVGLGNVGWRCMFEMQKVGDRLLRESSFDLVLFSTTIFPVMLLGKRWWKKFGVPYVLDFQDPWRSDYHIGKSQSQPPGGKLKYGITQLLAKWAEPIAMSAVEHVISVSPRYPQTLQQRYDWLKPEQFTVLPFGAPEKDFEQLPALNITQPIFDRQDGKQHWVYVGRGGTDMHRALRLLFNTIARSRQLHPELWQAVQLHFVGTSYAPPHLAVKTIEQVAEMCGVADIVTEHTSRIPYFEAQQLLVESDVIMMIGSDDASYTASKLYPCILAKKPILAIFHPDSSVVDILHDCQAGEVITFSTDNATTDSADSANADSQIGSSERAISTLERFAQGNMQCQTNWDAFAPYTGKEMTRQLCEVFDAAIAVADA